MNEMQDLTFLTGVTVFVLSLIVFIILIKQLRRFPDRFPDNEEIEIKKTPYFSDVKHVNIPEKVKELQDQNNAAFFEPFNEKLESLSNQIKDYTSEIMDIKNNISSNKTEGLKSVFDEKLMAKTEDIISIVNNILETVKDDRAILVACLKEEMKDIVDRMEIINKNIQSLQPVVKFRKSE